MIESGHILCVVKAPMIPDVNVTDGFGGRVLLRKLTEI